MQYLFVFLGTVVRHAHKNLMTAHNLAVVFTPNLVRDTQPAAAAIPASQQEAMATAALYMKQMNEGMALIQLLIVHNEKIFQ